MRPFSLLIKPASADCNMNCKYCFYLGHSKLYPKTKKHRMSESVLERMIKSYIETAQPQYSFGWQGGEPTLMGVDFFRRVVHLQKKYGREGDIVTNSLQTNCTLIDDEFAKHLARYNFLVGVSLDGPEYIHDRYRKFVNNRGSHEQVMHGIECLQKNKVEFNILTLVNNFNVSKAKEVYHYLGENGFYYHQYIPCVEFDGKGRPLPYSISGEEWSDFLCELYDEWYKSDTRKVSIRLFDSIVSYLVDGVYNICHMGQNCNQYFTVEYNGDCYPCDFFVRKGLKLGNILRNSWEDFIESETYREFGKQKSAWSSLCTECEYQKFCNGDCLKYRIYNDKDSKTLSWLCIGWKKFYKHALPGFRSLAERIQMERAHQQMKMLQFENKGPLFLKKVGRNDPCPCGSGLKYKYCCGK